MEIEWVGLRREWGDRCLPSSAHRPLCNQWCRSLYSSFVAQALLFNSCGSSIGLDLVEIASIHHACIVHQQEVDLVGWPAR